MRGKKKIRVRVTKKDIAKQKKLHKKTTTSVKLICHKKIHPVCVSLKGKWEINTTKPELYTDEVKRTWVCLFCKDILKGE